MKKLLRLMLKYYLNVLARIVLVRWRPAVIAIAGSVNKTFFKDAVVELLRKERIACASTYHAFNTEIGLPLTILGLPSGYESYRRWAGIMAQALIAALRRRLPAVLVLELGADHSGDIGYLTGLVRPKIAIITGLTKRYLENFGSISSAVSEYGTLAASVPAGGLVIANADTPELMRLSEGTRSAISWFSLTGAVGATYRATKIERTEEGMEGEYKTGETVRGFSLDRYGMHHVSAFLAAQAVGEHLHLLRQMR